MKHSNFNTDFFSYNGEINRKDYAINMLILIGLFFALSLINPENFIINPSLKIIAIIMAFVISLTKFVICFSSLSLIYRRIKDITYNKSITTKNIFHKLFIFIYVVPILSFYIIAFLFADILPFLMGLMLLLIKIAFPIMIIFAIIISFFKGR